MTIQQENRAPMRTEFAAVLQDIGALLGRLEPDLDVKVLVRSFRGALAPVNAAIRRFNDIKIDELPADDRHSIERGRQEIVLFRESLNKIYAETADRVGVSFNVLTSGIISTKPKWRNRRK
jgi:hypothetical protein